jgi:hypothetical protein
MKLKLQLPTIESFDSNIYRSSKKNMRLELSHNRERREQGSPEVAHRKYGRTHIHPNDYYPWQVGATLSQTLKYAGRNPEALRIRLFVSRG